MQSIKAIETRYKGYRFRSRLEARWAVFFDAMGIKWEYEQEGFRLPTGECYLPDFWLPVYAGGMFVEVKPEGGDFTKATTLCFSTHKQVLMAEGTPSEKAYAVCTWDDETGVSVEAAWLSGREENRPYWGWGEFEVGQDMSETMGAWLGAPCTSAVKAARSARFEHGECGA